jgi:hypothetical protein
MLQITIPPVESYDEIKDEFINSKEQVLQLEHSLVSLSKWESKFCKPFLTKVSKTNEETIEYIRCMTLTQNIDPEVYNFITQDNIALITAYIEAPMTATTFSKNANKATNREIITAEIIYYWMIALNVPFECQKWHLNRLLTLINVCNIKNQPTKKMGKKDLLSRNRALNESRRLALNTSG